MSERGRATSPTVRRLITELKEGYITKRPRHWYDFLLGYYSSFVSISSLPKNFLILL